MSRRRTEVRALTHLADVSPFGAESKPGYIPSWHTVSRCRTRTEDERVLTISVAVGISRSAGQYARYVLIMSGSDESSVSLASSFEVCTCRLDELLPTEHTPSCSRMKISVC